MGSKWLRKVYANMRNRSTESQIYKAAKRDYLAQQEAITQVNNATLLQGGVLGPSLPKMSAQEAVSGASAGQRLASHTWHHLFFGKRIYVHLFFVSLTCLCVCCSGSSRSASPVSSFRSSSCKMRGDDDEVGGEADEEHEKHHDASESISQTTASFSNVSCGPLTTLSGTSTRIYAEEVEEVKEQPAAAKGKLPRPSAADVISGKVKPAYTSAAKDTKE